ncbi:MAG TPA: DoxX family protein [Ramlibacter sp.]|nr:DoxX family protein [Ramlibacter sp.]
MAHTIASDRRQAAAQNLATTEDAGKLLLRLAVGLLILLHGIAKMTNGVDPIAGMLAQHGWPAQLAYGVYIGEVLAPLCVIVGLWTRPAALLMAVNMLFAIALVHSNSLLKLRPQGGGWALELEGLFLFGAIAIALLGAGRLSVGGTQSRWN